MGSVDPRPLRPSWRLRCGCALAVAGVCVGFRLLEADHSPAPAPVALPTVKVAAPKPLPPTDTASKQQPPLLTAGARSVEPVRAQAPASGAGSTITGSPTGEIVSQRATAKIREADALAERGALFAARAQLLDVLRMLAEAKDQKHGAPRRVPSLEAGLRAMDEADDFAALASGPNASGQLELLLAAHRTPVGRTDEARGLMPPQLADLYFRYAQTELGSAVVGEPAGSMALHALGKLYSQFDQLDPGAVPQAERRAFAMQQAALAARPDNYLASHELGVLLAERGHFAEAQTMLARVAAVAPEPVVYRNLARVQRKMGRPEYATANERQAELLARQQPRAAANGVAWVPQQQFARSGQSAAPINYAARPQGQTPAPGPQVQTAARPGGPAVR